MRKLVIGCAVSALIVLSPRSEARPPAAAALATMSVMPKTEIGLASWYGDELNGNLTADGEIFDMYALTAAHREFPIGTRVKVRNLLNNRSVTVRINDRGPNIAGRLIDVSMAGARTLGFLRAGIVPVELEVVRNPGP